MIMGFFFIFFFFLFLLKLFFELAFWNILGCTDVTNGQYGKLS